MASRRTSFSNIVDISIAREVDSKYDNIKIVADAIEHVETDSVNIDAIINVSENIDMLLASQVIIENLDEVLLADDNAAIATAKAEEASVSAAAALVSATEVEIARVEVSNNLDTVSLLNTESVNAAQAAINAATGASSSENAATVSATNAAASATAASESESNASVSEANSAMSASNAMTSESNALASATAANTSELNAAVSEVNAANSASLAESHLTAIETIYDNFDDRYLGAFVSDPTVDNDGDPLIIGAIYFNTIDSETKFYNGGAWESPEATASQSADSALASALSALDSAAASALSESNASISESNSSASALSASTSATTATTQAGIATAKAQDASDSADSASVSATTAQAHLIAIESIYDNFDDRYLGVFAIEPVLDNDGNALMIGAIYFDSTLNHTKFYNGVSWEDPELSAIEAANVATTKASEASNSADRASASEINSALSASNASASEQASALSESNASISEVNALASENAASVSEVSASASAANALVSETNALVSETNAANAANAALISEQNAANSETIVSAAKDVVDTLVLGAFANDPITDSNGNPVVAGAIYYNTVDNMLKVYDGSMWVVAVFDATGAVLSFNGREGVITLSYMDVIGALGFDPADRANHTGTQLASTISDFDMAVSSNVDVNANTLTRHTHTNKTTLDLIDQNVSSTGTPSFDSVHINGGTGTQGTLSWNVDDETVDLIVNSEVTYQLGEEMGISVRNLTGITINNGTVVRVTGASGSKITVGLASNVDEDLSASTFAVVTQTIGNNSTGKATSNGLVRGLDTSALVEGGAIWLGVDGVFTQTKPESPAHLVLIGWVVRSHATEGMIFVHIANGWEVEELHDVLITSIQDGDVLVWDSAISLWVNKPSAVTVENVSGLGTYTEFELAFTTAEAN